MGAAKPSFFAPRSNELGFRDGRIGGIDQGHGSLTTLREEQER